MFPKTRVNKKKQDIGSFSKSGGKRRGGQNCWFKLPSCTYLSKDMWKAFFKLWRAVERGQRRANAKCRHCPEQICNVSTGTTLNVGLRTDVDTQKLNSGLHYTKFGFSKAFHKS